jgi:hypothetical protein
MNVREAYAAKVLDMNPDNSHPRLPSQWSFGDAISLPREAEGPDELDDRRLRGTSTAWKPRVAERDARLLHPLGGRWLTARPLFYFRFRYARVTEGKGRDNYQVACQI